ncbi:MAG: nucleoside-diphosphate sugar epimerase/dehydratase [Anaerovoracaceae bacterium]|nr:polysaccharide biosynthesis protein [Bacillota bacterium]MEE0517542.1 nucleoside-diphosphate sugar epimerase/dehydratase [Anaerovoracaceae bacterium]
MDFLNGKNFRIFVLAALDMCCVALAAFGALILRFDISSIPEVYYMGAVKSLPVYFIVAIAAMMLLKLYNRVWTYASLNELIAIVKAAMLIEGIIICYHVFVYIPMPRSYYPLTFGIMTILFSCVRFAKAAIKSMNNAQNKNEVTNRIMVIGAGSAATILIKELRAADEGSQVVCAIDDNKNKKNKYILGVPIVGGREEIGKNIKKYDVTEIVIAMPSADLQTTRDIIRICQETKKPVKILPAVAKSLTSSLSKEIRPVNYEDLLGREPVKVNQKGIENFINGKVVMVTGGGGSIGSELCRQIVRYNPKKLLIFDIYENNAYEIQMELERHYPEVSISTLIGSVRDYDRMEAVFVKYRPDIVYHAAAHKHVPLMEKSPNEAIKNNCMGTLNAVQLADKHGVDNFVLISTDKAVRPTNIMGATKRICEMIVQIYAKKSEHTRFTAVRFGNVLGSNGSVIPLFLKQIAEGGPVTVTHKEITRFFMTIPEAVSLVLQASLFAKGGEIFVLDMGKPVRIYELAENLIRLKGLKPNEDIKIEIVGLRPGEKLYEEILMDEEGLDKTENKMIYIGKPLKIDEEKFLDKLNVLIKASFENGNRIKELTEEVCDTYTITDN